MLKYLLAFPLLLIYLLGHSASLIVTSKADAGNGTLRNTISNATSGDSISFSSSLSGDSIVLTSGEIIINKNLIIQGLGADKLILSASKNSRIFKVDSNVTLTIRALTIQLGRAAGSSWNGYGGAIYNEGDLLIEDVYFTDNKSTFSGGAIFNHADLEVKRCAFVYNKADSNGGGIASQNGIVHIVNTTFSSNIAKFNGGGFYQKSVNDLSVPYAYLDYCTFAYNKAGDKGGGAATTFDFYKDTTIFTISNSIVALNEAITYGVDMYRGLSSRCYLYSGGNNLIGNRDSSGILAVTGDILGNSNSEIDPLIGSLVFGKKGLPYHPLDCGTPCMNGGSPFTKRTIDQLGNNRVYLGVSDIGAVESQKDLFTPFTYLGDDIDTCTGSVISFSGGGTNDSVNWYLGYNLKKIDDKSFTITSTKLDSVIIQMVSEAGCFGYDTLIVKLVDKIKPVLSNCPSNIKVNSVTGSCKGIASWTPPTATDNCSIDKIVGNYNPGDSFHSGTTYVIYKAYDEAGNFDSCFFTVKVEDKITPNIICPNDITVNIDISQCGAVIGYQKPIGTDNCDLSTTKMIAGYDSGAVFPAGITEVKYMVTDAAGNTDTCGFFVTVVDNIPPQIIAPADIVVGNDVGSCGAKVVYQEPVGTDNCSGATTNMIKGLASGGNFPLGVTEQAFVVVDQAGNSDTCYFKITVEDREKPVIDCPSDIESCTSKVIFDDPNVTDNCNIASLKQIGGLTSGSNFPEGVNTIVFIATDDAGNVDSCSFNITVLPIPSVELGEDMEIFYGDTFTFYPIVKNAYNFEWTPIDGLDNPIIKNPLAQPLEDVYYILKVTSAEDCEDSDTIFVKVVFEFIIPTGFTPNMDGANDLWDIKGIKKFPESTVEVYDRWGTQVFYSNDYINNKWDGTFNGEELPMDTYYYVVSINDGKGPRKGTVTIIR